MTGMSLPRAMTSHMASESPGRRITAWAVFCEIVSTGNVFAALCPRASLRSFR